ncbi:MAG: hypothetical protein KAX19_07765 [Candidatus Brocadiae bacterium]|nr:hypothetical protein [Candidatus Brocadiia bacterium]
MNRPHTPQVRPGVAVVLLAVAVASVLRGDRSFLRSAERPGGEGRERAAAGITILYVAPDGNDAWSGGRLAP